jgi:hypothetical protein
VSLSNGRAIGDLTRPCICGASLANAELVEANLYLSQPKKRLWEKRFSAANPVAGQQACRNDVADPPRVVGSCMVACRLPRTHHFETREVHYAETTT